MKAPGLHLDISVRLDKFDLAVNWTPTGRVLGLFGPSGSGKTTILEILAGLRKGASGIIRCGEAVWMDSARKRWVKPERRGIGYVPQDLLLFPHMNVRQNLCARANRSKPEANASKSVFRETVRVLELETLLDRPVQSLSGGERQRVALGRALCSAPQLLILDEPLSSLDSKLRHRILPYLLRVRDQFDIPILIVSHNPVEIQALCEEVVAIDQGQVVARGTPADVFAQSRIYTSARGDGFENIMPATVHAQGNHSTRFLLGKDPQGQAVHAPRVSAAPGTPVLLGIRSTEIMLARQHVSGLSARNCLSGTLLRMEETGQAILAMVRLDRTGMPPLVVELTHDATLELALTPGQGTFLVIKSNSITPYFQAKAPENFLSPEPVQP